MISSFWRHEIAFVTVHGTDADVRFVTAQEFL